MEILFLPAAMLGTAGMVLATAGFPGVPFWVDQGSHPFAGLLDTFEPGTFTAPEGHTYDCRLVEPRPGVLELRGCRRWDG